MFWQHDGFITKLDERERKHFEWISQHKKKSRHDHHCRYYRHPHDFYGDGLKAKKRDDDIENGGDDILCKQLYKQPKVTISQFLKYRSWVSVFS